MKLQDYLHYYMGATFWTDNSQGEVNTETLKFIYPMIEKGKGVQLHLRRLANITGAEAIYIASLAMFDQPTKYPIIDFTVSKQGIGELPPSAIHVAINNDWYEMSIAIGFNSGNIWYTKGEQRVFNQPAIFHYLLKQQFDLFGLIEAGLAVDAKTLKQ